MAADIVIYTTSSCPYCIRVKQLFAQKNIGYQEIRIDLSPEQREVMIARTGGRRSVPQVFINDQSVGGCDDLYALDSAGKLDPLLK
jgi:glutaredoxin 3